MENENEFIDSTTDTETTENEEVVEDQFDETTEPEVDVEALKKENATLKAQKDHWKKKAEGPKPEPKTDTPVDGLTAKDVLVLSSEGVTNQQDVESVEEYARFKKITIAEALKQPMLKQILATQQEERKTAQVTQTRGGARAINKNTGDELWKRAQSGNYPDNPDDLDKMLEAKYEQRRNAAKK